MTHRGAMQPMYVLAVNIGFPLMPDYSMTDKNEREYELRNYERKAARFHNIPD